MAYTKKQLVSVWYALDDLSRTDSRRVSNCSIKTSLALDWGCNHGGTITCVSNQDGMYGFRGISINYSWGSDHAPGSTSGHNMCFSLYSDGSFGSGSHWTTNNPENQKLLGEAYVPLMANLYGTTPEALITKGYKVQRARARENAEALVHKMYKAYLKNFIEHGKVGESPLSYSAFKKQQKNK